MHRDKDPLGIRARIPMPDQSLTVLADDLDLLADVFFQALGASLHNRKRLLGFRGSGQLISQISHHVRGFSVQGDLHKRRRDQM